MFLPLNLLGDDGAGDAPCWSSRPQVRKMFHMLRSVTFGLVAAGVITRMPFSW